MDHPFAHKKAMDMTPSTGIVLCPDRNQMKYVQRFYPQIGITGFIAHGGIETDLKVPKIQDRKIDVIYAGNRFFVYALYPECEISIHVAWGFRKQNTAVMIGKSIINRNSNFDIGMLCLSYGGGGHKNAGTCQLENDKVDSELPNIIKKINEA